MKIADVVFDESCLSRLPDLPMYQFKVKGIKYSATNLKYLNEVAVNTFLMIVKAVAAEPREEITFQLQEGVADDLLDVVNEILMSIRYSAKKGGKNGFSSDSTFLVHGCEYNESGDKRTMTYKLIKDHAKIIHDYAEKNGDPLHFYSLVVAVEQKSREEMLKHFEDDNK